MQHILHTFSSDVSSVERPEAFTYPFFYTPHALTELATKELQERLETADVPHNFGLGTHEELLEQGKMFGVLVVEDAKGNWLGCLPTLGNWRRRTCRDVCSAHL